MIVPIIIGTIMDSRFIENNLLKKFPVIFFFIKELLHVISGCSKIKQAVTPATSSAEKEEFLRCLPNRKKLLSSL